MVWQGLGVCSEQSRRPSAAGLRAAGVEKSWTGRSIHAEVAGAGVGRLESALEFLESDSGCSEMIEMSFERQAMRCNASLTIYIHAYGMRGDIKPT